MKSGARLYRQIVDSLQQSIRQGRYPVGSYLPSERDLAKQFAVSRSSVREAIIVLEVLGWIEVRGGTGALVLGEQGGQSALPFAEPAMAASAPSSPTVWSARAWWQTRLLLEPEGAAMAARERKPQALLLIKEAFLQSVAEDLHGQHAFKGVRQFYLAIAQASANAVLSDFVRQLLDAPMVVTFLRAHNDQLTAENPFHAQQERLALLSALECGDESLARYRLRSYLMTGLEVS